MCLDEARAYTSCLVSTSSTRSEARSPLLAAVRHPAELGREHVVEFLSALAIRRNVSASTQNQALAAISFLYRDVLKIPLEEVEEIVRAKRPVRLPVVLTRE